MIALLTPASEKICRIAISAATTATKPKSAGVSNRARIATCRTCRRARPSEDEVVQRTPENVCFLRLIPFWLVGVMTLLLVGAHIGNVCIDQVRDPRTAR